jgi:agmatine deiminase
MPAEWERHAGCYIAWPCNPGTWHGHDEAVKAQYAEVANAIRRFEPVTMLTPPRLVSEARAFLEPDVEIVEMDLDDSWVRDNGPFFVTSRAGAEAAVHFGFNGWGGRFTPYERDAEVPALLAKRLGLPYYRAPMILEGGAISVDGEGTLLTTESCLLNPNRNPGRAQGDIEGILKAYLGARKVIWLPGGMHGSQVDGHIDGVAAFVRPGEVIAAMTRDPADPSHRILTENRARLANASDSKGRTLEVHEVPVPRTRALGDRRIASTYVNFYVANGGVVAPLFGDAADDLALARLEEAFPDREVVGIRAEHIAIGGGVIHCITQQRPSASLASSESPR